MDDDRFLARIRYRDLRRQYQKEVKGQVRQVKEDFKANREDLVRRHISEIRKQQEHDQIVNLCLYPFVDVTLPPKKLGYEFVRAAPLAELGLRNFDFLILNQNLKKSIAIFGEAKTTVTNQTELIRELKEKREEVQGKLEYVKANYFKSSADPILEYALGVPTSFSTEAVNAISQSSESIVLWTADQYDQTLKLGQPPNDQSVRVRMSHHDPQLMRALGGRIGSSAATFDFFPQSHTVRKLKTLLECYESTPQGLVVSNLKLAQLIKTQLFYLDDTQRSAELSLIIKEAERIGFATRYLDKPSLRIVSKFRKMPSLEQDLEEKWAEAKLGEDTEKEIDRTREKLQVSVLGEQEKRPSLEPFLEGSGKKVQGRLRPKKRA